MDLLIRSATLSDAPVIRALASQLGYPVDLETLRNQLAAILELPGQAVLVAETEKQVYGWVYLSVGPTLLTGLTAEIGGLVVDESRRGRGIGRALLEKAWAPEAIAAGPRAAYFWCPEGFHDSAVAEAVSRALGDSATMRNWATVGKLLALSADVRR